MAYVTDNDPTIFTAAQCREVDRIAIEEWHIPGIVLMENAGRGAADAIVRLSAQQLARPIDGLRIAIFCGSGNNGGDGYVIARHLANRGATVRAWASKSPGAGDVAVNFSIAQKMGLVSDAAMCEGGFDEATAFAPDIVLDALLGTGVTGPPRSPLPELAQWCNAWRAGASPTPRRVIAIDVPSGMDCDTGEGLCVRADLTITFAAMKRGFFKPAAREKRGDVCLVDIGVPTAVLKQAALLH